MTDKKHFLIIRELIANRKLLMTLAKNDFKSKFAGSYLGGIWAFIQPIVTVFVYWFVFEKALNVGAQSTKAGIGAPYVLWLVTGIVPWFYFSDAFTAGTNALLDYSYLVKKVVFKIEILPVVKLISGLIVHVFFIVFACVVYLMYGYKITPYLIQIVYYSLCTFVLAAGLSYITSAIVVFFRDLSQIINILMQLLIWGTPIMWNIDAINPTGALGVILRLNPMYYVTDGYRDAFLNHVWFFEKLQLTISFWVITAICLLLGVHVFKRLRPHFADVL